MLKIFIGYDKDESVAWFTLAHSIISKSSIPISLTPLNLSNLKDIHNREKNSKQSNAFSFTRFLVPYLSDYSGWALYLDCDQLMRVDVKTIFDNLEDLENKALYCVKHDYVPKDKIKYLGTTQYEYPRKNWSSVILWNCSHASNKKVTLDFVNTAQPMELHRFLWLKDHEIGSLNIKWNWLVGEYDSPPKDVKNVHWTNGGPYFDEYKDVDFSAEWNKANDEMNFCMQLNQKIKKKTN